MPPRFAYWTILIDNAPTAFRAREAEELLPTVAQLKRTNANVILKWFARGRLWDSQQQERDDFQRRKWRPANQRGGDPAPGERPERRSKDWRPGGDHKDPRARFSKEKRRQEKRAGDERWQRKPAPGVKPWPQKPRGTSKPWQGKAERPGKPWRGDAKPGDRPWHGKPKGGSKPWRPGNRFGPRKPQPHGPSFKTKWKKDDEPRKKRDKPEDE